MKANIYENFDIIKSREEKELFLNQKAKVIWLTGLSGSGKSTIASNLEKELFNQDFFCHILDGDNIRSGININLGFSVEDRKENIRRISETSKLFLSCGIIIICAVISPTNEIRQVAKNIIGENDFLEIFVDTPLDICEERDQKGLYKKARSGEIKNFTGITSPYEIPDSPFLHIKNSNQKIEDSVNQILLKLIPEIKHFT